MRKIEQIKEAIEKTKIEMQKQKDKPSDWRIGRSKQDPEMVAEREEFFELMDKVNEIMQSNKIRMNELNKENPQDIEEFELLEEHHKLMLEQLFNFYR